MLVYEGGKAQKLDFQGSLRRNTTGELSGTSMYMLDWSRIVTVMYYIITNCYNTYLVLDRGLRLRYNYVVVVA